MKNTTKTKLWAAIWIVIGLVFLIIPFGIDSLLVSIEQPEKSNTTFIIILKNIFSSLAIIAFFSGAWEILSKKSFAKEVLELSNVSANYIDSGIMHVYKEFTDIDWKVLFKDSKNVICFFTYAYSWRSNNRSALNMLKEQGTSITIILPNYNNDSVVDTLNQDFKYGKYAQSGEDGISKDVKNLIQEAETYFKNFGATVKLYNGNIKTTYYLVDNKCIMAPFKHGGKKSSVPAILCKEGGTLFDFCRKDIDSIIEESN